MHYSVHEAETHLPELLAKAAAGEDVTITSGEANTPVAKLVPCPAEQTEQPAKRPVRLGLLKGKIPPLLPGDPFFDPLPEEELHLWNGEGD